MPMIHEFYNTGQAYDASQCRDDIKDGDILIVPNEGAIAILCAAWPTAITNDTAGEHFHQTTEDFSWESEDNRQYLPSVNLALFALSEWERVTRKNEGESK
jgi:hypothetical protein